MQTSPDFDLATRSRAWSDYWALGVQHSCAGSFADDYGGQIGAFWQSVFATLGPQAQVLDACCGNSPLGRMLLTKSEAGTRVAHLAAVDAARISPPWLADAGEEISARVSVHGTVDVAAMPFEDARFDLCMSQYGIEYAGAPAFAECGRVLRVGGRFAAVLHHADALQVRIGREECTHIDELLGEAGLFARAQAMIAPLARAATEAGRAELMRDPQANAARAAFNEGLRALQARIDAAAFPDVLLEQRDAVMQLLSGVAQSGAEAGRQQLDALRQSLLDSRLRQQELVRFALSESALRTMLDAFPGEVERLDPLHFDNNEVAGWALVAVRR